MNGPKLLSKMSYKTVCGKLNRRDIPENGKLHVMRVLGQANGFGTGNSDYGQFTFFKGQFEATNVATGEVFRSGKLFLPLVVEAMVVGAFSETVKSVDFGFDIFIVEADNAVGYEYAAESLTRVSESDPVAILKRQLEQDAPALPKPTKAPALPAPDAPSPTETPADESALETKSKKK